MTQRGNYGNSISPFFRKNSSNQWIYYKINHTLYAVFTKYFQVRVNFSFFHIVYIHVCNYAVLDRKMHNKLRLIYSKHNPQSAMEWACTHNCFKLVIFLITQCWNLRVLLLFWDFSWNQLWWFQKRLKLPSICQILKSISHKIWVVKNLKFSSNQVFSNFFSKNITFTKFLPKMRESKFSVISILWIPHSWLIVIGRGKNSIFTLISLRQFHEKFTLYKVWAILSILSENVLTRHNFKYKSHNAFKWSKSAVLYVFTACMEGKQIIKCRHTWN